MTRFNTTRSQNLVLANKRVLHVINANSGGGVEHLATSLARHQSRLGAEISTFFLYDDGSHKVSRARKILGIAETLMNIIRFRPDILVTYQPTSSVIASLAAKISGCKIRIIHQSNLPHLTHKIPRFLDRLAGSTGLYSVIIMNSQATRRAFAQYPERYRRRLRDIAHGISWLVADKDNHSTKERFALPADAPILFSCARLSAEKSLETIISALPDLPDVVFVLAGDGAHKEVLQKLSIDLGVQNRVRFIGHIDAEDIASLYEVSDLFVFPSLSETFGMAAVEAAMAGLPIIASDIPPIREVLTIDGLSPAIFVKDWTAKNWVKAISTALKEPERTAQAQGFAVKIRAHYSADVMLDHYHKLYKDLLG